jgi:hypothetical protein
VSVTGWVAPAATAVRLVCADGAVQVNPDPGELEVALRQPHPFWLDLPKLSPELDVVACYWARQFGVGRRFDLVPTRANGQPAFGASLRVPAGIRHAAGIYVLTLAGDRICAMTRFDNSVLPWFGLPRSLPSR